MRFECNCKNEIEFDEVLNECHSANDGWNFEIGARLWWTPGGCDWSIMVEYQVSTQTVRDLIEEDEPDWFMAYCVDDEHDDDPSAQIWGEPVGNYTLEELQSAMISFAQSVYDEKVVKED